jgi:transcriptional regulator with XRE-family HTH domain
LSIPKVSIKQIKAARELLGWSQGEMASASGVSIPTIKRLEAKSGELGGRDETREKIRATLEAAGVEFTNGDQPGVKLIKNAKGVAEISQQIEELEDKISSIPAPTEPSPEAAMNTMRKAVAKSDLAKLKNRRARITRRDRSK